MKKMSVQIVHNIKCPTNRQELLIKASEQFGVHKKNLFLFEIYDNRFSALYQTGDILVFDRTKNPTCGDITLYTHINKKYVLWLLGKNELGFYIACDQYTKYPMAKIFRKNNFCGVAIGTLRA